MFERYPALLWGGNVTRKRVLALGGAMVIALVLAFALQDVVRLAFVVPLAYVWWVLGVLYSTVSQVVLWGGLVLLVAFLLLSSLASRSTRAPHPKKEIRARQGNVEDLAVALEKTRKGTYNKWKVANRLGRLARDLLVQRGDRENTKVIGPLTGRDWQPSEPVRSYLDVGVNGSFADYPNPRWPFGRPQPTPLDLDVSEAVEFLEAQMKPQMNADKQR
jgi:hypothetical protein